MRNVVNIGIGGSDLGPRMVTEALTPYASRDLGMHCVSNVDGTHIAETLRGLDPESTLFIVASKTFTTQETLSKMPQPRANGSWNRPAASRERWRVISLPSRPTSGKWWNSASILPICSSSGIGWEGTYTLWSAIGLSIAVSIGMENFEALLDGAAEMDEHFRTAPLEEHASIILGLIDVWYNNFFGAPTHAILPYDQYLRFLPPGTSSKVTWKATASA